VVVEPPTATLELLTEIGLDSGLTPSDVKRQIESGWEHGRKAIAGGQQQAEGFDVEPPNDLPPRPVAAKPKPVQVVPPPGAKLFFVGANGRECDGNQAVKWTWHGAKQWYSMESFPLKSQKDETDRLIEQALLANGENLTA